MPLPIDHLKHGWSVEAAKQIDFPISTVDSYGRRVVVARVPITSKVDAEAIAHLVSAAPDLLDALDRLSIWTGALAVAGSVPLEAWQELGRLTVRASAALGKARGELR